MSRAKKETFFIFLIFSFYLMGNVLIGRYPFYRINMYSTKMEEVYYYQIMEENNTPYNFAPLTTAYLKSHYAKDFLNPKFDANFALHTKMNKQELQPLVDFIFANDKVKKIKITRVKGTTSPQGSFHLNPDDQWEFQRD